MPTNKFKQENDQLRKEAEESRREVDRLSMKIEIILEILKQYKEKE